MTYVHYLQYYVRTVKSKVQYPPLGIPRAFDALVVPGGGAFDHYTYGVGNLSSILDFVLRVPVSERGLINHGGGLHVV